MNGSKSFADYFLTEEDEASDFKLKNGSRIGVIGGGPAGAYFTYFVLDMAQRLDMTFHIDVYEPRVFHTPGPVGCNHCGGIISELLVQTLATEGINLPGTVVQRGIESYVLHMDVGSVKIQTPLHEMRIGAVHRGAGPKTATDSKWASFDAYLQDLTLEKGASIINERVRKVTWEGGRPQVWIENEEPRVYDLLVVATGVNSNAHKLFNGADLAYRPPESVKTIIREYHVGAENIEKHLGSAMHVFMLDIERLKFAAAIPKGDYVTVCLLGEDVDLELYQTFLDSPVVERALPPSIRQEKFACHCAPRINIKGAYHPYADRLVFVGDCAVTRLYKDGIGGAYRTAKAAASAAVFHGVSSVNFEQHYWPACQAIASDNEIGKLIFKVATFLHKTKIGRKAVLNMTTHEQMQKNGKPRMSMVLWDMFTGSASYRDIMMRTFHPSYIFNFSKELLMAATKFERRSLNDYRNVGQSV